MTQRSSVLVVLAVLVVALASPAAASTLGVTAGPSGSATVGTGDVVAQSAQNNTTNDSVAPGARLAGVVSVQGAEVSGEVDHRAFGHRIANANSDNATAAVLATEADALQVRLTEIHAEQERLRERYENGSLEQGQYKARMAKLVTEARTIDRILDSASQTAHGLPADALTAHGIGVTAIDTLRANASALTGPEVAAIAKEIAGNEVGGPPISVGPQGNVSVGPAGNTTAPGPNTTPGNGTSPGEAPGTENDV
jgi:ferritin-like metal-binding protein YciE